MANPGVVRVHGGIITDQMLSGSLAHFKMTKVSGDFGFVTSDGDVTINFHSDEANTNTAFFETIDEDSPVPESAAELAFRVIAEKANIVQISIIDADDPTDGRIDEIHFALENTSVGWTKVEADGDETMVHEIDPVAMQDAIRALGTVTVPTRSDDDTSGDEPVPVAETEDIVLSDVVVEMVPYILQ